MTDCTEPHRPHVDDDRNGEGQKGMPSQHNMTDCTEPHRPHVDDSRNSEGQKGMRKVGTA
jgi:hypothetical protein